MKRFDGAVSRREFLTVTGALAAVLAVQSPTNIARAAAGESAEESSERVQESGRKCSVGLELYSVRSELARDIPNTLRTVAKIGYETVEFYSPYFNWSLPYAKEVRTMLDDLGLRCYSTHNSFESFTPGATMAKAIELNQILGARIIVLASAPTATQSPDDWRALCEKLSSASEQFKPHGLFAGFHNHQPEWAPLDGSKRIMDVIAANTPHDFVLQFDVGTCLSAGADPVAWIKANPGRIRSVHLKDWAPGDPAEEKNYRVLFGEGVAPWKEILDVAESVGGVEFYLLEQEGSRFSEFETAQRCLEAWKRLRNV